MVEGAEHVQGCAMLPIVLPLRMILFQSMFLMMAIAIESSVLRRNLGIPPKKSVEYATVINFLATIIGWLLFLNIQSILPPVLRVDVISAIFFDRWARSLIPWTILAALITFFMSLLIKWLALWQLQFFLGDVDRVDAKEEKLQITLKQAIARRNLKESRMLGSSDRTTAVLIGNALSYSAISLVLVIRLLAQGSLNAPLQ